MATRRQFATAWLRSFFLFIYIEQVDWHSFKFLQNSLEENLNLWKIAKSRKILSGTKFSSYCNRKKKNKEYYLLWWHDYGARIRDIIPVVMILGLEHQMYWQISSWDTGIFDIYTAVLQGDTLVAYLLFYHLTLYTQIVS